MNANENVSKIKKCNVKMNQFYIGKKYFKRVFFFREIYHSIKNKLNKTKKWTAYRIIYTI